MGLREEWQDIKLRFEVHKVEDSIPNKIAIWAWVVGFGAFVLFAVAGSFRHELLTNAFFLITVVAVVIGVGAMFYYPTLNHFRDKRKN